MSTVHRGILSAAVVLCAACGQKNVLPLNLVGAKKCRNCGSPVRR
jgi:hypothetical protein